MCGIAGLVNLKNENISSTQVQLMTNALKHRGPDDEGVFIDKNVGLGFVRLSVIDLSMAGHQPMFSDDRKYVIVFNGEIFNYLELRNELKQKGYFFKTQTDTEVLLNSYKEWGEECQHKFNGMWAFAIYDIPNKHIFFSRDRYGIKPFYYYCNDEFFAFASEIPALLTILPKKVRPNYQSIFDYLVFNRTDQNDQTFFDNIKKLHHGHSMSVNLDVSVQVAVPHQWYNLRTEIQKKKSSKFTVDEFHRLFIDAIGIRLRSDVPVGVCLSGGLDSSAIVSTIVTHFKNKDLNTFSAIYNKGQSGDELSFIKLYEDVLKNMYYIKPDHNSLKEDLEKFVSLHAEPIPTTSPYAQFKVMELAKGKVVVTLDGQGADEILAGYHYFYGFYFKDLLYNFRFLRLLNEIYHYLITHKSIYGLKTLVYFLLPTMLRTRARVYEKKYLNKDFIKKFSNSNTISGNLYSSTSLFDALVNHFEYKLEHLLKWEDRNSMAFSLEARVPFLDHRLVESTLSTDSGDIIKKGMTKNILREAMRNVLPETIRLRRDKIGFGTPQDEWFREPSWQIIVNKILNSPSFNSRNLIDVKKAKMLYIEHLSGRVNVANEIWKWVHLELWFRKFID